VGLVGRFAWPFSSGAGGGGGLLEEEFRGNPWKVGLGLGVRNSMGILEELGRERRRERLGAVEVSVEAADVVGRWNLAEEVGDGRDL